MKTFLNLAKYRYNRSLELSENKQTVPIISISVHMEPTCVLPRDLYLLHPSNRGVTLPHSMGNCQHLALFYLLHVYYFQTFHTE